MSNETTTTVPFADAISAEVEADTQAVLQKLLTGQALDPETERRIRERAERIAEELRRQHGVREIAVDLVRESRDER